MCFAPAALGDSTHSHTPLHVYPDLTFNKYLNLPHFQILSLRPHSYIWALFIHSSPFLLLLIIPLSPILFFSSIFSLLSFYLFLPLPLFFCLALRGSSFHASHDMQSTTTSTEKKLTQAESQNPFIFYGIGM